MARPIQALLKLAADPAQARRALGEVSGDLKALDRLSPEARVRINDEGVRAQIDRIRKRLAGLSHQEATPDVKIRMANALRQIDRLEGRLKGASGESGHLFRETGRLNTRFGKVWARGGGGLAAIGGLYGLKAGITDVIRAYQREESANSRLQAQLKAQHLNRKNIREELEKTAQVQSRRLGFARPDVTDALTNLIRGTGSPQRSQQLLGLAADIARARNVDLGTTALRLGKVQQGQVTTLNRFAGVQIDPKATPEEAIAKLQARFAGQAEAHAKTAQGSFERLHATLEDLQATIGKEIVPTLTKGAEGLTKFIGQMQDGTGPGGEFAKTVKEIAGDAEDVAKPLFEAGKDVAKFAAAHPEVTKLAVAIGTAGFAIDKLRSARAVRGLGTILGALRKLAKTKAGEEAASSIASGLSGGTGKIRDVLKRIFRRQATAKIGDAAAAGTADELASAFGPSMNAKEGRIRTILRRIFRRTAVAGGEQAAATTAATMAGAGAGPGLGGALNARTSRFRAIFSRFGGRLGRIFGGALLTAAAAYLATHFHDTIGNTFGKIVLPLAPRGGNPGRDPHPDHHTPPGYHLEPAGGGRFFEVPNRPRHEEGGLGVVRRVISPVGLSGPNALGMIASQASPVIHQTFPIITAPSPDYSASRWQHRTADAMRRRGVAFTG